MSIMIEITDDYNIKILNQDGLASTSVKYIEINDLINILQVSKNAGDTIKNKCGEVLLRTPIFPSFGDVSTLQYIVHDSETQHIILKKDACKHDFNFHGKIYKKISIPTTIFTFRIYKGLIQAGYVACVKDKVITEDTKIYKYPFGNVYSDTRICFGANSMANHKCDVFQSLHSMPSRFLLMETTSFGNNKYKIDNYEDLYKSLQTEEFDLDKLIPHNMTYKEYIESITCKIDN